MERLVGEEAEAAPAVPGGDGAEQCHPNGWAAQHGGGGRRDDEQVHGQPEEPCRGLFEYLRWKLCPQRACVRLPRMPLVSTADRFHGSSARFQATTTSP